MPATNSGSAIIAPIGSLFRRKDVIRLVLLLLGADFIRERWRLLAVIGAVWGLLGLALFIDALDGVVYFPIHIFGYLLIIEALVTLVATTSNRGDANGTSQRTRRDFLRPWAAHHRPTSSELVHSRHALWNRVCGRRDIAHRLCAGRAIHRLATFDGSRSLRAVSLQSSCSSPIPLSTPARCRTASALGLMLSGFGTLRLALRLRKLAAPRLRTGAAGSGRR